MSLIVLCAVHDYRKECQGTTDEPSPDLEDQICMYSSVLFVEDAEVTSLLKLEKIYRVLPQNKTGYSFVSSAAHYLAWYSTLDLTQNFEIDSYFYQKWMLRSLSAE